MKPPRFSVILPVYQGEAYLDQALQSLSQQSPERLRQTEIIAVDDGSTDRSPEILEKWKTQLPLKVIQREQGSNWMAATNDGLKSATGEWISFLHQDDCWHPDRLEALDRAMTAHPDIRFFCHPTALCNPAGKKIGTWSPPWPSARVLKSAELLPCYSIQNNLAIPAPCFHRSLLDQTEMLREDLWFLADWDFWIRLIHHAETSFCLPQTLANFRLHPESQTQTRSDDTQDLRRQFSEIRNRITQLSPCGHSREKASRVNEDLTLTLAAWSHKKPGCLGAFLRGYFLLGPQGWFSFPREARLAQRIFPRLRLQRFK
ncbi:glycosyltransferase [Kiritimatiellaeota bacterium B1221]|nr:glycosyltransferase [Kiritimatiellaeota bacterium B1221]